MKFYIAEGEARTKLLELGRKRTEVMKARNKMVGREKSAGAVSRNGRMMGLVFRQHPGKPWKLSKTLSRDVPDTYVPDNSKEGRALRLEMQSYTDPVNYLSVSDALEVQAIFIGTFTCSAFTLLCGHVVVGLDDRNDTPKGCRRISDMEYEELVRKEQTERESRKKKGA